MAKKRSRSAAAAREGARPATPWRVYTLAGALLLFMVGAVAASQLLWASATPEPNAAPAVSAVPLPANGKVVSNAVGGDDSAQTLNLYGGGMRPLVEERDGVQTLNIYGPGGRIIAQVVQDRQGAETVRYLLTDHLGSTRVVVDAEGNAVARYEYAPHGETTVAGTAAGEVRYRYTGHPYDEGQEVYETPNRGYEPTLGRFLSVDPQRDDASPYVYAGNNPLGYVDPTGGGRVPMVPYFMKSGMEGKDRMVARSIAKLFGVHKNQEVARSAAFKKPQNGGRSSARKSVNRFLYGKKKPGVRKFKYNEKFFWIMGEEEGVPNDLYDTFTPVRKKQGSFANKMVLLDFTGTKNGEDIQAEFGAKDQSTLLIEAEIAAYGKDEHRDRIASGFKVDGRELKPDEFQAHVEDEMFREWSELPMSIDLSPLRKAQSSSPSPPPYSPITGSPGSVAGSTSMPSAPISDDSLLVSLPLERMNSFLRLPVTSQIPE